MIGIRQFSYREHWQEIEITLERPTSGDDTSLGFTIASSIHIPFHRRYLTPITIINISKNGLAYRDKRLELYDIILRVNHIDFTNIKHKEAVNILRKAGPEVKLLIRRLSPSINEEIKLKHNGKLGISIAGGIGKEYLENDHGIFIRNIKKSRLNTQLYNGDRLITISSLRYENHGNRLKNRLLNGRCTEGSKILLEVRQEQPQVISGKLIELSYQSSWESLENL
ncbi:unnamed protein product [Rotaria sordida]|uniref:PDZ domain-containing protein n=1 Tax=Rotaria sordida TaxID=392033 RepID=A0A819FB46_9BILA|nr:unnamed protein product [Rotaria sordida]CAF3918985.1 unnamed protein product [Rotaria sordida]